MAKAKKEGKKSSSKKKSSKKPASKKASSNKKSNKKSSGNKKSGKTTNKKSSGKKGFRATKRKFRIVIRNLILWLILLIFSYTINVATPQDNSFVIKLSLLGIFIFGFVSLAFVIVLLVLLVFRMLNK